MDKPKFKEGDIVLVRRAEDEEYNELWGDPETKALAAYGPLWVISMEAPPHGSTPTTYFTHPIGAPEVDHTWYEEELTAIGDNVACP